MLKGAKVTIRDYYYYQKSDKICQLSFNEYKATYFKRNTCNTAKIGPCMLLGIFVVIAKISNHFFKKLFQCIYSLI